MAICKSVAYQRNAAAAKKDSIAQFMCSKLTIRILGTGSAGSNDFPLHLQATHHEIIWLSSSRVSLQTQLDEVCQALAQGHRAAAVHCILSDLQARGTIPTTCVGLQHCSAIWLHDDCVVQLQGRLRRGAGAQAGPHANAAPSNIGVAASTQECRIVC